MASSIEPETSIRTFYLSRMMHAEAAAREYAQLALRSIITLNAGVAVAYPTIAEVFVDGAGFATILWPTGLAVLGAVMGVLCAYSVFFNHMAESNVAEARMHTEIIENQSSRRGIETNQQTVNKAFWMGRTSRQDGFRTPLFWTSTAFGVLSLCSFAGSIIWFALSVIADPP